jgi:Tfp pilus assembly protein FimT
LKKNKGATLLELLIACLIIGILASTASPFFIFMLQSYETENVSKDLKLNLQSARLASLTNGKDTNVFLDHKSGKPYWLVEQDGIKMSEKEIDSDKISLTFTNKNFYFSSYGFLMDQNSNPITSANITICNIYTKEGYKINMNSLGKIDMEDIGC